MTKKQQRHLKSVINFMWPDAKYMMVLNRGRMWTLALFIL